MLYALCIKGSHRVQCKIISKYKKIYFTATEEVEISTKVPHFVVFSVCST